MFVTVERKKNNKYCMWFLNAPMQKVSSYIYICILYIFIYIFINEFGFETIQRIDMFSFLSCKNTESNLCLLLLKEGRKESEEYYRIKLKGGWERKISEFCRVIVTALHCNTQDPLSPVMRMCTQQRPEQARIFW